MSSTVPVDEAAAAASSSGDVKGLTERWQNASFDVTDSELQAAKEQGADTVDVSGSADRGVAVSSEAKADDGAMPVKRPSGPFDFFKILGRWGSQAETLPMDGAPAPSTEEGDAKPDWVDLELKKASGDLGDGDQTPAGDGEVERPALAHPAELGTEDAVGTPQEVAVHDHDVEDDDADLDDGDELGDNGGDDLDLGHDEDDDERMDDDDEDDDEDFDDEEEDDDDEIEADVVLGDVEDQERAMEEEEAREEDGADLGEGFQPAAVMSASNRMEFEEETVEDDGDGAPAVLDASARAGLHLEEPETEHFGGIKLKPTSKVDKAMDENVPEFANVALKPSGGPVDPSSVKEPPVAPIEKTQSAVAFKDEPEATATSTGSGGWLRKSSRSGSRSNSASRNGTPNDGTPEAPERRKSRLSGFLGMFGSRRGSRAGSGNVASGSSKKSSSAGSKPNSRTTSRSTVATAGGAAAGAGVGAAAGATVGAAAGATVGAAAGTATATTAATADAAAGAAPEVVADAGAEAVAPQPVSILSGGDPDEPDIEIDGAIAVEEEDLTRETEDPGMEVQEHGDAPDEVDDEFDDVVVPGSEDVETPADEPVDIDGEQHQELEQPQEQPQEPPRPLIRLRTGEARVIGEDRVPPPLPYQKVETIAISIPKNQVTKSAKGPQGLSVFVLSKIARVTLRTEKKTLSSLVLRSHTGSIVDAAWYPETSKDNRLAALATTDDDGIAMVHFFWLIVEGTEPPEVVDLVHLKSTSFAFPTEGPRSYYTKVKPLGSPDQGKLALIPRDGQSIRVVSLSTTELYDPNIEPASVVEAPPPPPPRRQIAPFKPRGVANAEKMGEPGVVEEGQPQPESNDGAMSSTEAVLQQSGSVGAVDLPDDVTTARTSSSQQLPQPTDIQELADSTPEVAGIVSGASFASTSARSDQSIGVVPAPLGTREEVVVNEGSGNAPELAASAGPESLEEIPGPSAGNPDRDVGGFTPARVSGPLMVGSAALAAARQGDESGTVTPGTPAPAPSLPTMSGTATPGLSSVYSASTIDTPISSSGVSTPSLAPEAPQLPSFPGSGPHSGTETPISGVYSGASTPRSEIPYAPPMPSMQYGSGSDTPVTGYSTPGMPEAAPDFPTMSGADTPLSDGGSGTVTPGLVPATPPRLPSLPGSADLTPYIASSGLQTPSLPSVSATPSQVSLPGTGSETPASPLPAPSMPSMAATGDATPGSTTSDSTYSNLPVHDAPPSLPSAPVSGYATESSTPGRRPFGDRDTGDELKVPGQGSIAASGSGISSTVDTPQLRTPPAAMTPPKFETPARYDSAESVTLPSPPKMPSFSDISKIPPPPAPSLPELEE